MYGSLCSHYYLCTIAGLIRFIIFLNELKSNDIFETNDDDSYQISNEILEYN